jgi:hypothetical protein
MDATAEIKRLYYQATKASIQKDLERAIDLLKSMPDEDARQRVAVYMDGLSQMRSEWSQASRGGVSSRLPSESRPSASGRPGAALRGRSGPSKSSSRRPR